MNASSRNNPSHRFPMKRLSPRHELILNDPLLLVGEKRSLFVGDLLAELLEPLLHHLGSGVRIGVMNSDFVESAVEEFPLHCRRRGIREEALFGAIRRMRNPG